MQLVATDASGILIHQSFSDELQANAHGNYNNNRVATNTSGTHILQSFKLSRIFVVIPPKNALKAVLYTEAQILTKNIIERCG